MTESPKVKGVILAAAQDRLQAMIDGGELKVPAGAAPECLGEKVDPAAWCTLDQLNAWVVEIRELIGSAKLQAFGHASAAGLSHTGIYKQFDVTLDEHGFSLGSKLMLSFAGVSHPYTEWRFAEIDENTGGTLPVSGSAGWNDEQCAVTCGWVEFLAQKLFQRSIATSWSRAADGDVVYRIDPS